MYIYVSAGEAYSWLPVCGGRIKTERNNFLSVALWKEKKQFNVIWQRGGRSWFSGHQQHHQYKSNITLRFGPPVTVSIKQNEYHQYYLTSGLRMHSYRPTPRSNQCSNKWPIAATMLLQLGRVLFYHQYVADLLSVNLCHPKCDEIIINQKC
ncbi:hypothetical protein VTK56DRAFT_1230 [Thermocarpiscus australiensis]